MATKAEWQKVRDEIEKAPGLGVYAYREGDTYCAIGWLCREELKAVPDLRVRLMWDNNGEVYFIMSDPGPDPVRKAVRERLTGYGLTVRDAARIQTINDAWKDTPRQNKARVLEWLDAQIAGASRGDEG